MKAECTKRADDTLVVIDARLDMKNAMELEQQFMKLAEDETKFTLDFAHVPYISSAGIRALLSLYRTVAPLGGSVSIVNASDEIKQIMEETDFSSLFNL